MIISDPRDWSFFDYENKQNRFWNTPMSRTCSRCVDDFSIQLKTTKMTYYWMTTTNFKWIWLPPETTLKVDDWSNACIRIENIKKPKRKRINAIAVFVSFASGQSHTNETAGLLSILPFIYDTPTFFCSNPLNRFSILCGPTYSIAFIYINKIIAPSGMGGRNGQKKCMILKISVCVYWGRLFSSGRNLRDQ